MSDVASQLCADLDLPAGYICKYDPGTDNILIYNQNLGFCITQVYIRNHLYVEIKAAAAQMLSCLVKETAGIARFQPTSELLNPRIDTKFDGSL